MATNRPTDRRRGPRAWLQAERERDAAAARRERALGGASESGGTAVERAPSRHFVAVAEVEQFATLARHVGYDVARAATAFLREQIVATLGATQASLAGRATIEFVFSARSETDARARLMRLARAFSKMPRLVELGYQLNFSIGVAHAGEPFLDLAALGRAEQALSEAQRHGQKVVFCSGHAPIVGNSLTLLADLRVALLEGRLENHYQPKLRTRSREITAVEALVRWTHPVLGAIPPDAFVPLAEESGQIRALTELVIDRALADRDRLLAAGHEVAIDVNLSGALMADLDFTAWAIARVSESPGVIGFEITETAMIANPGRALANLTRFAEAGIRISIDDYGSGFSSLAYLQKLPAHELKIDKGFISGIANTQRDPLLVRSTIELAHALDMEVVAEGVDTPEALALLQVMGCDAVQGYLISPPVPVDELASFLTSGRAGEIGAQRPSLRDRRARRLVQPAENTGSASL